MPPTLIKGLRLTILFFTGILLSSTFFGQQRHIGSTGNRQAPAFGNNRSLLLSDPLVQSDSLQAMKSVFSGGNKKPSAVKMISKPAFYSAAARVNNMQQPLASICYTIAGRDFLRQDSLVLYPVNSFVARDGNIITCGEFVNNMNPGWSYGGFCMKTDIYGNAIWTKLYDSLGAVNTNYLIFWRGIELSDGTIVLAGRTTNPVTISDDFVLMKLDANGNLLWFKNYQSRFWQAGNGSADYFSFKDLREDPQTGEIYFTGHLWGGPGNVTKVNQANGNIIWSKAYDFYQNGQTFGVVAEAGRLTMFQLAYGGNGDNYISTISINKTTGDTLFTKHLIQAGGWQAPQIFSPYDVVRQNNGHFLLTGGTTGFEEYPYTGTVDLYHAAVVELDNNFNFVKAFGFKNRVKSNFYNTKISVFPDGTGVFTMINASGGWNGEAHVSIFRDDLIYHQRKRIHNNEGIPEEPKTIKLPDGGYLNIKILGDSTATTTFSKVDFHRMYSSDTASECLGVKDSATSIWHFRFEPYFNEMEAIHNNVFAPAQPITITVFDFSSYRTPACQVISHCDTLDIEANVENICPGNSLDLTIHKNKECGSLIPLQYDTTLVSQVILINDSTYRFSFRQSGSGYIRASLMGCVLHEDSVFFNVLPERYSLNLGPDTIICPGNRLQLNAGTGFADYHWQDGSVDSVFIVTAPGKYYVTSTTACGTVFTDTVNVADHPPIPLSIGADRFKCNSDTIHLRATQGFMNYAWSPAYNISSLSDADVIVNPLTNTTYTVAAEKTPGCFAYDTVRITVSISPAAGLAADTSICRNDSIVLKAANGFQLYEWNTGAVSSFITVKNTGEYFVKATSANGCISYDTMKLVTLYDLPQPDLGPDSVLCREQNRVLATKGAFTAYVWNTGSTNPQITATTAGSYWLTVTDNNGCKGSDTTIIASIKEPPSGFLGTDSTICSYGSLDIAPLKSFRQQLWSTGSNAPFITVNQPGVYWLQVTDENNCKGRDSIIINLRDCMTGLYVPSAFTPNGDGLNDLFKPYLFGDIKSFRFILYNRWGEVVFDTKTPGSSWDGIYRGRKMDTNVLVWVCQYQLNGEAAQTRKGKLTVIR